MLCLAVGLLYNNNKVYKNRCELFVCGIYWLVVSAWGTGSAASCPHTGSGCDRWPVPSGLQADERGCPFVQYHSPSSCSALFPTLISRVTWKKINTPHSYNFAYIHIWDKPLQRWPELSSSSIDYQTYSVGAQRAKKVDIQPSSTLSCPPYTLVYNVTLTGRHNTWLYFPHQHMNSAHHVLIM